jgi:hypothetical protein
VLPFIISEYEKIHLGHRPRHDFNPCHFDFRQRRKALSGPTPGRLSLSRSPAGSSRIPDKIWISVVDVINELLIVSNTTMDEIASIGITNQRETTIVWDKRTGKAIYNAIVWQSKETQVDLRTLHGKQIFFHRQERTGLRLNPYFSASKIRFILENVPRGRSQSESGRSLFRDRRQLAHLQDDQWQKPFHRCHQCLPNHAFNIFEMAWDPEFAQTLEDPGGNAPRGQRELLRFRRGFLLPRRTFTSMASLATSKPLCSANAATKKAKARTLMAPAASC